MNFAALTNIKLPLFLTLIRIVLTLPIIIFALGKSPWMIWAAIVLFILASITDYYDGYFARKNNQVTNLGKFLDPVADKILVSSLLILFVFQNKVDIWMVILFITRDTLIGGIRAAASADGVIISAQTTGKWKAALQMISIPLILLDLNFSFIGLENLTAEKIGYFLLWFSVGLSLFSGWQYIQLYVSQKKEL